MNTDLINRLRTYIYATTEAKGLAAEIIQLLERNYPCHAKFTFIGVANNVIGDVAKATGAPTTYMGGFHELVLADADRPNAIEILIRSTYQPNYFQPN